MSYYKCKGISRKGNKIEVNVASSNCFPITYYKSEYKQRENQETLFWLYVDIEQGNLHLNRSTKNITIPKNLIHIAKNGYKFTGKHSRKMSIKIDYIREELLKVVENCEQGSFNYL